MKPEEIHGIFDDDGYEINPDLIPKPSLCLTCVHDQDPSQEVLCSLTRYNQQGKPEFTCYAYTKTGTVT